jgi:two-component system, cell cycle sensor histidine kinase and response regulator CckA
MASQQTSFDELLEAAPDAMVGVAPSGRIVVANTQAARLFGYARDELIGHHVEILVPLAVRAVHPGHRARYLDDPQPRPMGAGMELAARRQDGTEFPAEISLKAVSFGDEMVVLAAIRDVTERRRAAEAQARLASIVQSSHDAVIGKTLDGVVTSWNPGAERLYGFTADEIIGRPITVLVPEAYRHAEAAVLNRIRRGERVEQYRMERLRKDGSIVVVSITMSPIVDPRAGIVGIASVSRDVSDQQRAEAKFLGLLEAAPDAIVGVDSEGRIALVNAQAERLFGYSRDELVGELVEILVPEAKRAIHPQRRSGYFNDPQPRPMGAGMQLAARRRDGTEFPAEISLSALQTEEGVIVSAAIRDVSERLEAQAERERLRAEAERQRLESQLHQSQRLESLGQLAGGVAHDFNNLLAVISNYADFVAEEIVDAERFDAGRWSPVLRDVEQIRRAAERATRLTHQLLAFGRREVVRPELLDLNEVVSEVQELLRRTLGEHVELIVSRSPSLRRIFADPGQVEQVLVNLAVNARDAMPGGGRLSVDTADFDVDEDFAGQWPNLSAGAFVRLRVSDTGTGMEPEVMHRAFEPFYTTKPKGEGTGLGLATVYGIVTQAGGDVHIYSEVGVGTTITALLPAADGTGAIAGAGEPAPVPAPAPLDGATVLVVEDEEAMREVTTRILSRSGFHVLTAASGADAIAIAAAHRGEIHLLLTDVIMPKMLGKEVAERVRALRPAIRVLYMSGYAEPVLASQRTLDPGVNLIEKPFSQSVLLARVREVIDAA